MPKLLIIDDESSIRFSIAQVFETDGMQVFSAKDADEGLRLAAEEVPDVVLLDLRLGRRSGLDLFNKLKDVAPKMPVVCITGVNSAESVQRARSLGVFAYLVKPLDVMKLRQVVRKAVARKMAVGGDMID